MGHLKKHVAASRSNGASASNHGKLNSEPAAIIRPVLGVRSGIAGVTFDKVFRAKLHKNTKYLDECRATVLLERAAQVVRACYSPGHRPQRSMAACHSQSQRHVLSCRQPLRQPRVD